MVTKHCEEVGYGRMEADQLRKELARVKETLKETAEREATLAIRCNDLLMRESTAQAHWIYSPCDGVWTTACSHCGYEETGESMRKYKGCPMCRAKMTHIECVGHRKEIECRINSANGF